MNIIISLYKHWSDMILSGEKTLEFRTRLPKDFHIGEKIYFYETSRQNGRKMVVGEATVKDIISVCNKDGKWPMVGCYPFTEYYFSEIKKDEKMYNLYKSLKEELGNLKQYKYGYLMGYFQSPKEIQSLRENGSLIDTFKLSNKEAWEVIDANNKSDKTAQEIDNWLTKIGFYNKYEETNYKYAYVLDNIIKYEKPKNISEFKNKNGEIIKNPPQSYIYTIN